MQRHELRIPFDGFYETKFADIVESTERSYVEYAADKESGPEYARLTEQEIADEMAYCVDYWAAHEKIAADYIPAFDRKFEERFGFKLGLEFSQMQSPKYYNFETDNLFATMPTESIGKLWAVIQESDANRETLARVMRQHHKSRDGFISYYSHRLEDWPADPTQWDWAQLWTLLCAVLETQGEDTESEISWSIYYSMVELDYEYFDSAFDHEKFESRLADLREEKTEQYKEEFPEEFEIEEAAPERCPNTLDLFTHD